MKKLTIAILVLFVCGVAALPNARQGGVASMSAQPTPRPTPKTYIRGPNGGCYYISAEGNKIYVDRSFCY